MYYKTFLAGLMLMAASTAYGQSKFEKLVADPGKLEKAAYHDHPGEKGKNGKGFTAYHPAMSTTPKRVGLVTFYISDPGTYKSKTTKVGDYVYFEKYSSRIDGPTGVKVASQILDASLPKMKERFAAYGMELLTPAEFLDSDEKKALYASFEVKHGGSGGLTGMYAFAGRMFQGQNFAARVPAEGYNVFQVDQELHYPMHAKNNGYPHKFSQDTKMMEGLGDELCKGLGLDAVLCVYMVHNVPYNRKQYNLHYAAMYMFGPNPVPLAEGKKDGALYQNGLFYASSRLDLKNTPYIIKNKKNPGNSPTLTGVENVFVALSNKMGSYLQKEINKKK